LEAARHVIGATRSAYFPQIAADATSVRTDAGGTHVERNGVEQQLGSYITAGALNTSTLLDRDAAGIKVTQLISDFGKTGNRVDSAKAAYAAAQQQCAGVRASILLNVIEAYFKTLQAQATQRVAQKTVEDRRLELDKISLLTKAQAKSELDSSFAAVALEQSKVLLLKARNDLQAQRAQLAFAMGLKEDAVAAWRLSENETLPAAIAGDVSNVIAAAEKARPELARQRALYDAARSTAEAEKASDYPTLNMLAAAGKTFSGDDRLPDRYAAVGLNINMPIFAGGYYRSKQAEAEYRADAALDDLSDLQNSIERDVRVAWLNLQAGSQALAASERLRNYAEESLDLAQSRYNLGLSSIIELNRAELNAVDAQIQNIRARYEYQIDLARLAYQSGSL
jgi:outer membrane protein